LSYASYRSDGSGEFRYADGSLPNIVSTTGQLEACNGIVPKSFNSPRYCGTPHQPTLPLSAVTETGRNYNMMEERPQTSSRVGRMATGLSNPWSSTFSFP